MAPKLTHQELRAKARAEASLAGALKCSSRAADVDRALLAVIYVLFPGKQREKQVHKYDVSARGAFTRYLRRRSRR